MYNLEEFIYINEQKTERIHVAIKNGFDYVSIQYKCTSPYYKSGKFLWRINNDKLIPEAYKHIVSEKLAKLRSYGIF